MPDDRDPKNFQRQAEATNDSRTPIKEKMDGAARPNDQDRAKLAEQRMTTDTQRKAAEEKKQAAEELRAKKYDQQVVATEERRKAQHRSQELKRRCPAHIHIPSHVKLNNGNSYPLTPTDFADIEKVVDRKTAAQNASIGQSIDKEVDRRLANQMEHIADGKRQYNRVFRNTQSENALAFRKSRDRGLGD